MPESHVHFRSAQNFFPAKTIRKVAKKWGEEHWIVNKEYCGKKLILKKNRQCSMHKHNEKDEVFYCQSGKVELELGDELLVLNPGDFVHVKQNTYHRFRGLEDSEILEFSTHHMEGDSYRKTQSGHIDPDRYARQSGLLHSFGKQNILIVGDIMLDKYTTGSVGRISPEAPIPIVHAQESRFVPGGAANNAANVSTLGGKPVLMGVCGNDDSATTLGSELRSRKVKAQLVREAKRPTTLKHRIIGNHSQQIVRIDHEVSTAIDAKTEAKLLANMKKAAASAQAILIADYAKGVMTPKVYKTAYQLGKKHKIPVIVDPKPQDASSVQSLVGATVITPNVGEARKLTDDQRSGVETLGKKLSKITGGMVLLTRGGDGMDLYEGGRLQLHTDSRSGEVVDVSGAGDTVAATLALALAAGGSTQDAVDLANRAAAIVVGKHGTATVSGDELDAAL